MFVSTLPDGPNVKPAPFGKELFSYQNPIGSHFIQSAPPKFDSPESWGLLLMLLERYN